MDISDLAYDVHSPRSCLKTQQVLAEADVIGNGWNHPIVDLANAWLVVWSDEMYTMANAAADDLPQPVATAEHLMPRDTVLWLYRPKVLSAWPLQLDVASFFVLRGVELTIGHLEFQDNSISSLTYPTDLGEVPDDEDVQHTLKMMTFAQSPYMSYGPYSPVHDRRLKSSRNNNNDVRFITLRRGVHTGKVPPAGPERNVDWDWQWPVSGHWRRQWYLSDQQHRYIWIPPHIKGPEGKPFRGNPGKLIR